MLSYMRSNKDLTFACQAVLAGINLNDAEYKNGDNQPQLEALTVFRHIDRIARGEPFSINENLSITHATKAIVEVALVKESGSQVKHGLEL